VIDFDHQIIPDEISLGGLALALGVVPLVRALGGDRLRTRSRGARQRTARRRALLAGRLRARRVATAFGRRFEHWPGPGERLPTPSSLDYWVWFPGVGFGDVKLLALIGAVLGPIGVLQTILAASLAGLVLGGAFALSLRRFGAPFGFGPALAAGALLVLLAPDLLPR
jgi:prepilin signal peptidase PulO-like enzyme (type II secretory pathway)